MKAHLYSQTLVEFYWKSMWLIIFSVAHLDQKKFVFYTWEQTNRKDDKPNIKRKNFDVNKFVSDNGLIDDNKAGNHFHVDKGNIGEWIIKVKKVGKDISQDLVVNVELRNLNLS